MCGIKESQEKEACMDRAYVAGSEPQTRGRFSIAWFWKLLGCLCWSQITFLWLNHQVMIASVLALRVDRRGWWQKTLWDFAIGRMSVSKLNKVVDPSDGQASFINPYVSVTYVLVRKRCAKRRGCKRSGLECMVSLWQGGVGWCGTLVWTGQDGSSTKVLFARGRSGSALKWVDYVPVILFFSK